MPRGPGISQRAKEIVQEVYNARSTLKKGENLTKAIQQRIKREIGEDCSKDQINHVLRKLPNYQSRAGGVGSNKHLPLKDAAYNVVIYVEENTNPKFEPTYSHVYSQLDRWKRAEPAAGSSSAHEVVARTAEEPQPVSQAYPTPGILYFDHNLRILQPYEINHLSHNAHGELVDAEGWPVTTQQL
ncbi:hypothetical protein JCM8547_005909 [Rhodosporidiobolus lusitaniae]